MAPSRSSKKHSGRPPKPSLDVLPNELLLYIVQLSLPPPCWNPKSRYELLLAYSLVNSTWRSFAQQELAVHILIEDHDQQHWLMLDFLDLVGWNFIRRISCSPVTSDVPGVHDRILYALEKCGTSLQEVWLSNDMKFRSVATRRVLSTLGRFPVLTSLHLDDLQPPIDSFEGDFAVTLPHLSSLSLMYGYRRGQTMSVDSDERRSLLDPIHLPSLRKLVLDICDRVWTESLMSRLEPILPQLTILALESDMLDDQSYSDMPSDSNLLHSKGTSLRALYLGVLMDLPRLPPPLEVLRLSHGFRLSHESFGLEHALRPRVEEILKKQRQTEGAPRLRRVEVTSADSQYLGWLESPFYSQGVVLKKVPCDLITVELEEWWPI